MTYYSTRTRDRATISTLILVVLVFAGVAIFVGVRDSIGRHVRADGIVVRLCHGQKIYKYQDQLYLMNPAGNIFQLSQTAIDDVCKPTDLPELKFRFNRQNG